jgi:coatomer subunit beta
MLTAQSDEEMQEKKSKKKQAAKVQADDPIAFTQLATSRNDQLGENVFESSLNQALAGTKSTTISDVVSSSKLNKITQLTGFSDPVYAEAYVTVNQFDVVIDVLIVNQTSESEFYVN